MANVEHFVVLSDYRENQEGLDELALSIQSDGLYQPILVKPYEGDDSDKKYEIVAGRRRFRAMTEYLHWKSIKKNEHFIVKEGIDALIAQFQENFNRQDFTPIEISRLVRNIHSRQTELYGHAVKGRVGGWGLKDTGKLIGRDSAFVSRMITIAENENDVQECETISAALEAVDKKKTKNIQSKVRKARYEKTNEAAPLEIENLINNVANYGAGNFLAGLDDSCVDLVLTDPPYAINYNEMVNTDKYESYDDDPDEIKDILSDCIPEYYRVLKDDRYCIIFTAYEWQQFVRNKMLDAGFILATTPIHWIKLNATGKSMNPARNLGSQAEVAVYGWKGKPELNLKGKGNVFPVEIVRKDRIHVAQKPDELLSQLVKIFSYKGQKVLDTFCGSLSTLRGCYTNERDFVGCELSQDFLMEAVNYTRDWAKERADD